MGKVLHTKVMVELISPTRTQHTLSCLESLVLAHPHGLWFIWSLYTSVFRSFLLHLMLNSRYLAFYPAHHCYSNLLEVTGGNMRNTEKTFNDSDND
jgi:hypothetical protein